MLLGLADGEGPWASGYVLPTQPGPYAGSYVLPETPAPAPAAKPKAASAATVAAAIKRAASVPGAVSALAGFPWLKAGLIGAGVIGAVVLLSAKGGPRARKNPDNDDDKDDDDGDGEEEGDDGEIDRNPRRAVDFYRSFHWGREPKHIGRTRVSPLPRELVQLGTLEAITYSAKKGGEKLADYIHHFGEEGHRKPKLTADPRTKKLHIIGGDYGIEAAGIVR